MAIKNDRSDLPPNEPTDGVPPDEIPRFGLQLAQAWAEREIPEGERPHAVEGTRWRLSWAGKCARDLSYWLRGDEPSDPMDLADHWRMGLGTMVHDQLQKVFTDTWPNATIEHRVDLRDLDEPIDGSGHIDIYLAKGTPVLEDRSIVIEVKTINGFGFKRAIGARGAPEGPRSNALRQGALEALSVDADELVLLYLSLELLSPAEFARFGGTHEAQRFLAEWSYTKEEYRPIALLELQRVRKVLDLVGQGKLAPRSIPDLPRGARVVDPARGNWQVLNETGSVIDAGNTWFCGYCPNRSRCIEDGAS